LALEDSFYLCLLRSSLHAGKGELFDCTFLPVQRVPLGIHRCARSLGRRAFKNWIIRTNQLMAIFSSQTHT
jgi:hypothetical protein